MKVAVSVVIPAYNAARYIAAALASVRAQTFADWEAIVVDDGSTDETRRAVEPFRDRVRYAWQANRGAAAARNHGAALAAGRYIAYLDADDAWLPEKLAAQVEVLARGAFPVVHADSAVMDEEGRVRVAAAAPGKQPRDGMVFDEFFLSYRAVPNTSTLVVTRAALDAAGGWDESLQIAEDYDLSLRLAWRFPVCFIDRPLAATRMTAGSLSRGNASLYVACREIAVRNGIAAHREYFDARPELVALKWREFNRESAFRLFYGGDIALSRRYFAKLLRTGWRAWAYLLITLLPAGWISAVRRAARRMRRAR